MCASVCVCVCVYACMHACMCVCVRAYMCVSIGGGGGGCLMIIFCKLILCVVMLVFKLNVKLCEGGWGVVRWIRCFADGIDCSVREQGTCGMQ